MAPGSKQKKAHARRSHACRDDEKVRRLCTHQPVQDRRMASHKHADMYYEKCDRAHQPAGCARVRRDEGPGVQVDAQTYVGPRQTQHQPARPVVLTVPHATQPGVGRGPQQQSSQDLRGQDAQGMSSESYR